MNKTYRLKALEIFEKHLFHILPLYSVSFSDERNQVITYCMKVLSDLGRFPTLDKDFNIVAEAIKIGPDRRAIVAHTDTVGSIEAAATHQSIRYNVEADVIYNRSQRRAMGGDDKVGVAIALTIAELMPEVVVVLPANEEAGCIGSSSIEFTKVDFALQFDRRGCNDLVNDIFSRIATDKTTQAAITLLPHRKVVSGMITDVQTLVERELATCAFNMSCGYYEPHSSREYIVLSEAQMSMNDAITLLHGLDTDDFEAVPVRQYSYGYGYGSRHWNDDGFDYDRYLSETDYGQNDSYSNKPVVYNAAKELLRQQNSGFRSGTWPSRSELYGEKEESPFVSDEDKAYNEKFDLVDVDPATKCFICSEPCVTGSAFSSGEKRVCEECLSVFKSRESVEFMLDMVH